MDAAGWKIFLTINILGNVSVELRDATTALARKNLEVLTVRRLTQLDNKSGCPVGIREVRRRTTGKAAMKVVRDDVMKARGASKGAGRWAGVTPPLTPTGECSKAMNARRR